MIKIITIYILALIGGFYIGTFVGYGISHYLFCSATEDSSSLISLVKALSQAGQDTYAALGGGITGLILSGLTIRKLMSRKNN